MMKRGFNDRILNATADHIPMRCFILAYYPRHRLVHTKKNAEIKHYATPYPLVNDDM